MTRLPFDGTERRTLADGRALEVSCIEDLSCAVNVGEPTVLTGEGFYPSSGPLELFRDRCTEETVLRHGGRAYLVSERTGRPRPLAPSWLALLLLAALGKWWLGLERHGRAGPSTF